MHFVLEVLFLVAICHISWCLNFDNTLLCFEFVLLQVSTIILPSVLFCSSKLQALLIAIYQYVHVQLTHQFCSISFFSICSIGFLNFSIFCKPPVHQLQHPLLILLTVSILSISQQLSNFWVTMGILVAFLVSEKQRSKGQHI